MERWGIIYSPKIGVLHTHRRWEKIRRLLSERGVEYDFVQSEGHQAERRLAVMLAKNGYTTIVVVGGDGALNRVINGIASLGEDVLRGIRFGLVPNGYGNDFATFWGLKQGHVEKAVDVLVKGRTRRVDLGILQSGEEKYHFLNCVNVGLASNIFDIKYKARRLWGISGFVYFFNLLVLLSHRLDSRIRMNVNSDKVDHRLLTLCIGSCRGYGQTPSAVPYNGMLDVSAVSQPRITQLFHGLVLLVRGHFLNFKNASHYRTDGEVKLVDLGGAKISVDGQVLGTLQMPVCIGVKREIVNLIIP